MRVVRSWPAAVPAGRAHVVDELERLVMADYDYRILGDLDDDVLLLEWDIAVDREELDRFVDRVLERPEQPRVAPYKLYESLAGREHACHPLYPHRRYNAGEQSMRIVTADDPACHTFGFGLVYLPRDVIRRFLDAFDGRVDDVAFSGWHYRNGADPEVPIEWDVRPVHVHYRHHDYARP